MSTHTVGDSELTYAGLQVSDEKVKVSKAQLENLLVYDSRDIPHSCSCQQQTILKTLACDRTTYGYCTGSVHEGLGMEMDSPC